MKKFLSLLLVIAMFMTMMIGIGALSNTSMSNAENYTLGNKISFYSSELYTTAMNNSASLYYYFTVPYTGTLDVNFSAYCTSTESSGYDIVVYIYNSEQKLVTKKSLTIPDKATVGKTYNGNKISISIDRGTYYLRIEENSGYASEWYMATCKINLSTSFKCLHTNKSEAIEKESTCSEKGIIAEICNDCGKVWKWDLSLLPHTPADEWVRISEPTCSKVGEEQKSCTVCGGVAKTQSIDKLPHTYGEWATDTEPTCSKEGKRVRTCSVCGGNETESIDKLDHEYGDWERTTEPTCTVKGKETRECKNCGKSETNSLDMLEHSFSDWSIATAATCTSKGKETRKCYMCDKKETRDIPMLEHDFGKWEVYTSASCTSTGTERRYCKLCNKYETRTTEKTEHEYDDYKIVTQATCMSTGVEQGYCRRCGKTITENIPKLDHNLGEWTVVTEATCTKAGKKQATCADCGETETKTISKIDHAFGEWEVTTEPSCTKTGKQEHTCVVCGKAETETIDKTEHTVDEWTITREATETRKGTRKGKCTVCGKSFSESYEKPKYPGRSGFKKSRDYGSKFSDVGKDKWFHEYVQTAYEYELANGTSNSKFSPDSKFTVAQALTAAANIHRAYYGFEVASTVGGAWYTPYVNYCIENGIIADGQFKNYDKNITRGEMAEIFAKVLPSDEYTRVRVGAPSDMAKESASYIAVQQLYEAGIVSGDAKTGYYRPNDEIVRSEACVIFTRIAVEGYRAK